MYTNLIGVDLLYMCTVHLEQPFYEYRCKGIVSLSLLYSFTIGVRVTITDLVMVLTPISALPSVSLEGW